MNVQNSVSETISFEDLFKQFYPRLTAYARLLVDRETAEDITQDIFEHLWENRGKIYFHTSIESYLFKSVYNRCITCLNRQKHLNQYISKIEEEIRNEEISFYNPDNDDIIKRLFVKDIHCQLDTVLSLLPEVMRKVLKLSYLQEMKNKEIAQMLGISNRTVENHLSRGLKRLRIYLNKVALTLLL